jgi:hypothetical protein
MIKVWQEHPGKLQIGFCDIGTPTDPRRRRKPAVDSADFETETTDGNGNIVVNVDFEALLAAAGAAGPGDGQTIDYQSYGRLRRMLADAGMDVRRIRFIHDAKSDADRARLFRDCRRGKVDVILGSTDKLGVGTNIQRLVVAMHHIDAPFRPADVEQRDGRGLRPGNIHKVVQVYRYVTRRTFDAYMWQMLTRKLTFISQMLSGTLDRTVEDVTGDDVLSFAAIKAAATDQPLLQEKAEIDATIKKLRLRERLHRQNVARTRKDAPRLRNMARHEEAQAKAWEAIAAAAQGVDLTDELIAQIHAQLERYQYYARPIQVGALTVAWRTWTTQADEPETQPLLVVSGGDGDMDSQCYKFWKPADVKRRLRKVLGNAAEAAALHRDAQAKLLREADQCDAMTKRPFEQADELTAALARLDQINAELRDAAAKSAASADADAIVVKEDPPAEPAQPEPQSDNGDEEDDEIDGIDLAALADFAGAVMDGLESEVAAGMAALMGGLFD